MHLLILLKNYIYHNLLNLGVYDSYAYTKARKIRLVNFMAIVGGSSWLLFSIWGFYLELYDSAFVDLFGATCCFFSLIINRERYYKTAFHLMIIGSLVCVTFLSVHYGRATGAHFALQITIVVSIFVLGTPKRYITIVALQALVYVFLQYFFDSYEPLIYDESLENEAFIIQYFVLLVSIIAIVGLIEFFKYDVSVFERALHDKNAQLESQQAEIKAQNEQLEEQNTEIDTQNTWLNNALADVTSSVNYASRIQKSILIPQQLINNSLPKLFIINKPKDIVSGDFYWFSESEEKQFVAAVDCTGHGVPGAFMTAIGNTLLNQIVIDHKENDPSRILTLLHHRLLNTLNDDHQKDKVEDGMDIALCVIDKRSKNMTFAGAKRPLFKVNGSSLTEYKPTSVSIGGTRIMYRNFENTHVDVAEGDRFYIFSDGFADQFGGEFQKKLKLRQFKQMLVETQSDDLENQKWQLEQKLNTWQGDNNQTDDILLIGFEVI